MRRIFIAVAAALVCQFIFGPASVRGAPRKFVVESGKAAFRHYRDGIQFAREEVVVTAADSTITITSTGDMVVDRALDFQLTATAETDGSLLSYSAEYLDHESEKEYCKIEVGLLPSGVFEETYSFRDEEHKYDLGPSGKSIVLEDGIVGHLNFLLSRVDFTPGSETEIAFIVPMRAPFDPRVMLLRAKSVGPVVVEVIIKEKVTINDEVTFKDKIMKYRAVRLDIGSPGQSAELYVDAGLREIIKYSIPGKNYEAINYSIKANSIEEEEAAVAELVETAEVGFLGQGVKLVGTLTTPRKGGARAAVLIVGGTQKADRDGNFPIGVESEDNAENAENAAQRTIRLDVFKDMADYLSRNGLTVLRYDRRGTGSSDPGKTEPGLADMADDANSALECLRRKTGGVPVYVIGHSWYGAVVAELLCAKRGEIAGAVLIAPPALNIIDRGKLQEEKLGEKRGIDDLTIYRNKKNVDLAWGKLLDYDGGDKDWPKNQWRVGRDLLEYDYLAGIEGVRSPMLLLYGEADWWVDIEEGKIITAHLAAANSERKAASLDAVPFELRTYPGLNGWLSTSDTQSFAGGGMFVDRTVLKDILNWVTQ